MSESDDAAGAAAIEEAIEALAGFAARIGRKWRYPTDLMDLIDVDIFNVEGVLYGVGERSRREHLDVPALIRRDVGHLPLFEAAVLSHAAVHIAGSQWGRHVPEHARYVFAGLATRAISILKEIAVLLDHGYPMAAKARWRALSEILVVARVISLGDRFTATRYKEHRWVILAAERRRTKRSDWSGELPSPEVMERRLVKRFGTEYAGTYGWAARIAARRLGVKNPNWQHLQTLAEVEEYVSRVQDAHHAVHGQDALGLLGTIDANSEQFHAGATQQGVLAVARDAYGFSGNPWLQSFRSARSSRIREGY